MMTLSNKTTNSEAQQAFNAINDKKKTELGEVDKRVIAFQQYLIKLCDSVCKNNLKDSFVWQRIFTNEIKQKDYSNYCKANLFAATKSLNRVITKIEKEGLNKIKEKVLLDFICDLKPFVTMFDKEHDYSWLIVNPNTHMSNSYYKLSESVFWNGMPRKDSQEQFALSASTPFIIRQSIEYRIKRILGIDHILRNGKLDKTDIKVYFGAIRNNAKYYIVRNLDFEYIKKIHSWTNVFVHGGYRPEPWLTETALNYIEKLFYSGKTSQNNSYSIYASIEVKEADLEDIKENTESYIKKEHGKDVSIEWLLRPELAIIKNPKNL